MTMRLLAFALISLSFILSPQASLAQSPQDWGSVPSTTRTCVVDGVATIHGLECLFYNALQAIVFFAGLAFFVMFIVGGYQYLLSMGDSKKVAAASSTLTMAIIGLVGIILSWLIISLIQRFTGVNVTNFVIPYTP